MRHTAHYQTTIPRFSAQLRRAQWNDVHEATEQLSKQTIANLPFYVFEHMQPVNTHCLQYEAQNRWAALVEQLDIPKQIETAQAGWRQGVTKAIQSFVTNPKATQVNRHAFVIEKTNTRPIRDFLLALKRWHVGKPTQQIFGGRFVIERELASYPLGETDILSIRTIRCKR